MPRLDPTLLPALHAITAVAGEQAGICTAEQALAAGLSRGAIERLVGSGRWTRYVPGIFTIDPRPMTVPARLWAAHLALGADSVIAGRAAGFVWNLVEAAPTVDEPLHMLIPEDSRRRAPGVAVRRVPDPGAWTHPARRPPMLTVEHSVLDLARLAPNDAAAVEIIQRACRLRLTHPGRILDAMASRARVRRRELLRDVCAEVRVGVTSTLERRYHQDVGRAHMLPTPVTQERVVGWSGSTNYRDLRYDPYDVIVELDGRRGHEEEAAVFRDQFRDNAATLTGAASLRFGWLAIVGHACDAALQVGSLLALRGWSGSLRPCGPACPVGRQRLWAA